MHHLVRIVDCQLLNSCYCLVTAARTRNEFSALLGRLCGKCRWCHHAHRDLDVSWEPMESCPISGLLLCRLSMPPGSPGRNLEPKRAVGGRSFLFYFLIKKKRFLLFKNYVKRLLFNSLLLESLMPIEGNWYVKVTAKIMAEPQTWFPQRRGWYVSPASPIHKGSIIINWAVWFDTDPEDWMDCPLY